MMADHSLLGPEHQELHTPSEMVTPNPNVKQHYAGAKKLDVLISMSGSEPNPNKHYRGE